MRVKYSLIKALALLAVFFLCTACFTKSSEVLKLGPDTYSIMTSAAQGLGGGEIGAKKLAVSQANDHCFSLKKEILITNISTKPSSKSSPGTADITYQCLNKGDPDLRRPTYEDKPDLVVETR